MTQTLAERLRATGPTLDVRPTAELIGISGAALYEAIRRGDAPVRAIRVGGRIKIVTASVVELLCGSPDPVRSGEMTPDLPRSEAMTDVVTTSGVKCPTCGAPVRATAILPAEGVA